MFTTAALFGLNLLDTIKPKGEVRVEKYITDRVPMLELVQPTTLPTIQRKPKARPAPRRKHVCEYTRENIWGAFVFGLILGAFTLWCATHI